MNALATHHEGASLIGGGGGLEEVLISQYVLFPGQISAGKMCGIRYVEAG